MHRSPRLDPPPRSLMPDFDLVLVLGSTWTTQTTGSDGRDRVWLAVMSGIWFVRRHPLIEPIERASCRFLGGPSLIAARLVTVTRRHCRSPMARSEAASLVEHYRCEGGATSGDQRARSSRATLIIASSGTSSASRIGRSVNSPGLAVRPSSILRSVLSGSPVARARASRVTPRCSRVRRK